jgi:enoyl-CoA hydratase
MTDYQNIITSSDGAVGTITLNRPAALNALNSALMDELSSAVEAFESDPNIRCMIVTGSEKAFAAGADIKEMAGKNFSQAYREDFVTRNWEAVTRARKPVIAAVAGYALGGGCELAMMCDFIIAADNAKFGQPEINLAVGPGAGGTQRLTRAVGKAKAMEMCLTGRMMDAVEAERAGLVARVVPLANLMPETRSIAEKIAAQALPALLMIKECVNAAFETPLTQGIRFERRLFHALFATAEQKEGMAAFIEKRKPVFDRGP